MKKSKVDRRVIRNLAIVSGICVMASMVPGYFTVTKTKSVNHRFFFINRHARQYKRGDYVVFLLKEDPHFPNEILIKRVTGVPGDTVSIQGNGYLVNGTTVCEAKDYSLKGERLDQFSYEGILPEHKFFVTGENKDSYDSRYFGLVDIGQIMGVAYPIL